MKHYLHYEIAKMSETEREFSLLDMVNSCYELKKNNNQKLNAYVVDMLDLCTTKAKMKPLTIYDFIVTQAQLELLYQCIYLDLFK